MRSYAGLLSLIFSLWLSPPTAHADLGVKSLSGPPVEFEFYHLPVAAELSVPSNFLLIDQQPTARGSKAVETPGSSFSTFAGVGFSLIQVTTGYPEFGAAILTSPRGVRYEFRGGAITCNSRPCQDDQANLVSEAFRRQAPAGVAIFSISGAEVAGGSWTLTLQGPERSATVESMIHFEDAKVEVGIEPEPCRGGVSDAVCGAAYHLTAGAEPMLRLSMTSADAQGRRIEQRLQPTSIRWAISATDSTTRLHQQQFDSRQAASLPRSASGHTLLPLPSLPAGNYTVRIDVVGTVGNRGQIERTAFYPLPIIVQSYQLAGTASAEVFDDERLQIHLDIASSTPDAGHVYAFAEVWSGDGETPLAWIGGMTHPALGDSQRPTLPLLLDARWLALASEHGNDLLLRNIRIQDPDTFIPIDQIAELTITASRLPRAAFQAAHEVSKDETLYIGQGYRSIPTADLGGAVDLRGSSTGILLVHGWCSNPVWPVSDFLNGRIGGTGVFSDPSASRSHDAFARRIRDQGDARFSTAFSVVAHSQGGAAATHLRAFYSSGLDNITAPRRIQSMGTPYLGSTLMDLYFATGPIGWIVSEVFGLCGQQFSLTTLGSVLWNVSLPGFVRDEVSFYRTRHTRPSNFWQRLQFWRWRCNLASFIIPSADDGVVADFQGSFWGGNNLGITDGECHTGGMHHPSQTRNGGRNDTMDRLGRPQPAGPTANCFVQSTWQPGGPTGNGYFEYYVNASNSVGGSGSSIASYTWINGALPGPPTSNPVYGPLTPGLPGHPSSYTVYVIVTDTSGATAATSCQVP